MFRHVSGDLQVHNWSLNRTEEDIHNMYVTELGKTLGAVYQEWRDVL